MIKRKLILWYRYIDSRVSAQINAFNQSRRITKLSKFYFFTGLILMCHGFLSLIFYYKMLSSSSSSRFFDFKTEVKEDEQSGAYGCSVSTAIPFFFWVKFWSMRSFANYVLLAHMVLTSSMLSFATAFFAFLVFLCYRHFQSMSSQRYSAPRFHDKLIARGCKNLPRLLFFFAAIQAVVIAVLVTCVFFFNICDTAVLGLDRPLERIQNCRLWVETCAKDKRLLGRHLQCSLPENYLSFPAAEIPGRKTSTLLTFPKTNPALGITGPVTFESSDICDGESLSPEHGGPVPWCSLCVSARTDPSTGVYKTKNEMEKTGGGGGVVVISSVQSGPPSASPQQLAGEISKQNRFSTRRYPLANKRSLDQAFSEEYLSTMAYFAAASYVTKNLSVWSLSSSAVVGGCLVSLHLIKKHVTLPGHFVVPVYGSSTASKELLGVLTRAVLHLSAILTCGVLGRFQRSVISTKEKNC